MCSKRWHCSRCDSERNLEDMCDHLRENLYLQSGKVGVVLSEGRVMAKVTG